MCVGTFTFIFDGEYGHNNFLHAFSNMITSILHNDKIRILIGYYAKVSLEFKRKFWALA